MQINSVNFQNKPAFGLNPYQQDKNSRNLSYEDVGADLLHTAIIGYDHIIEKMADKESIDALKQKKDFLEKVAYGGGHVYMTTKNIIGERICFDA